MTPDLHPAAPEILVMLMACTVLIVDVYVGERFRRVTYQLSQVTVIAAAAVCILMAPSEAVVGFSGNFVSDPLSAALKVAILLLGYYMLFYLRVYLEARDQMRGEFFVLGLFSLLGMMVLVSAHSLLTVYLGLELMSLCLYAMVAMSRNSVASSEAAMKYFVLGALASGMLLYGMSLVYGMSGSLQLDEVHAMVAQTGRDNLVLILGLVFVLVGVAFKLGAVPFHMWIPDVYEGAPAAVTSFIASAPKVAAFGMLMRLLVEGLGALQPDWSQMLILLAALSIGVGNVIALAQTNTKRLLGYSAIAHVGFLFLGVLSGTAEGYAASMFYIISYAIMSLAAFGMVVALGRKNFEADRLDDLKGLVRTHPWFAAMMTIIMLSMAGVPPFLGFWAKWGVLREVVNAGHLWLAVLAVLFSVVGLFYYLRIVRHVYMDEPTEEGIHAPVRQDVRVMVSSNALVILALGIYPGALMALCLAAVG